MIQIAKETVKGVGIGIVAQELVDQIGVAAILERRDRIFLGISIEITDDQEVGVAAAGRIGRQPVDERGGCFGAGDVTVALAVAGVGIADIVTIRAFGFEVIDRYREFGAVAVLLESLRLGRAIFGVEEIGVVVAI